MKETTGADFKSATEQENKKLFIETYGCQMNVADSEVIASIMQMAGYSVCDALEDADAVFMNTCSIRDNAEQKILNRLEFFHSMRKNKKRNLIVGVLGCMATAVFLWVGGWLCWRLWRSGKATDRLSHYLSRGRLLWLTPLISAIGVVALVVLIRHPLMPVYIDILRKVVGV